ncbi:MAG: mechanosensitive ion channel domain-containing protein [Acidobacteriota bacterium]
MTSTRETGSSTPSAAAVVPAAAQEARQTVAGLWSSFVAYLPKIVVIAAVLFLAWLLVRLIHPLLRRLLRHYAKADAVTALTGIAIWILAVGIAVSVFAGDARALLGSIGLVGLALSWALQTPIESFTGWLLNSFQGYYRVGDRVAVGDVFGDVYRIDFLTTTVWEIGGPDRPGFVHAEQPTGRLITFPNNQVLSGSIVNLTRDFPFVWDELDIAVANESDLNYAIDVVSRKADEVIGEYMKSPAESYERLLKDAKLEVAVASKPQIFLSMTDSFTNLTVRYLVGASERRKWKSELILAETNELNKPEHRGRIVPAYPRQQIQVLDTTGKPKEDRAD